MQLIYIPASSQMYLKNTASQLRTISDSRHPIRCDRSQWKNRFFNILQKLVQHLGL